MDIVSQREKDVAGLPVPADRDGSRMVTVPAVEWCGFLERFGRRHRGWLATIHGFARDVPLTRVRCEAIESVAFERYEFEGLVRVLLANGLSLCAPQPRALRVQQTNDGVVAALEIETAAGAFVRLAFGAGAGSGQLKDVRPGESTMRLH